MPIIEQSYTGDITIVPNLTLQGLARVLQNPTKAFIQESTSLGESLTSDFLPMIKNHLRTELALQKAYRDVKEAAHFGSSQSDLRRTMLPQRRAKSRRFGSTQSMPGLRHNNHISRLVDLRKDEQKSGDFSSDNHFPREAKFEIDSDVSDDLDAESMTSLTPPEDAADLDSDMDMEPEVMMLKSRSAPASPRPSSVLGSPVHVRSRSPAIVPLVLLMTPSKVVAKGKDKIDSALHSEASNASLSILGQASSSSPSTERRAAPNLRGRQRSSSAGDYGDLS